MKTNLELVRPIWEQTCNTHVTPMRIRFLAEYLTWRTRCLVNQTAPGRLDNQATRFLCVQSNVDSVTGTLAVA
jgi:hypothetical protein